MWTCGEMKREGWSKLKGSFWTAVLVTLVFVFITSLIPVLQNAINVIKMRLQYPGNLSDVLSNYFDAASDIRTVNTGAELMMINILQSLVGFLAIAATFFLVNPLSVGYSRWFLTNRREEGNTGLHLLFSSFQQGSYVGILAGTAWMSLWTILWSWVAGLCFIPLYGVIIAAIFTAIFKLGTYTGMSTSPDPYEFINSFKDIAPGFIVAAAALFLAGLIGYAIIMLNRKYAYIFTHFILAENPTIGASNALNLSKRMAQGIKKKLFVLDLSFIGWWLLSSLTCGILSLGISPYIQATYTEVYISRKAEQHL